MGDVRISDLPEAKLTTLGTEPVYLPAVSGNGSAKLSLGDMAEMLWEQMYVKAKKVIVTCLHCGSANVITNSNCVSCGVGMGEAIERRNNGKDQQANQF